MLILCVYICMFMLCISFSLLLFLQPQLCIIHVLRFSVSGFILCLCLTFSLSCHPDQFQLSVASQVFHFLIPFSVFIVSVCMSHVVFQPSQFLVCSLVLTFVFVNIVSLFSDLEKYLLFICFKPVSAVWIFLHFIFKGVTLFELLRSSLFFLLLKLLS